MSSMAVNVGVIKWSKLFFDSFDKLGMEIALLRMKLDMDK